MTTSSARRGARVAWVLVGGLVLAGCATMPDTGEPPASPAASGDSTQSAQQVVVVAEPPKAKDQAPEFLAGFLDDLVSDEQDYHTAKQFLTNAAAAAWNPQAQVTVLDSIHMGAPVKIGSKVAITVTGSSSTPVATLNARHAYEPPKSAFSATFVLEHGPQGYRIDKLPEGIILNKVDFARIYESVNLYFPVARPQGTAMPSALVADPIYVRSHIDPLTDAADALVGGPSEWLAPAVRSAFPAGSSLGRTKVAVSADGSTQDVRLDFGGALGAALGNDVDCGRMAVQLYFTLSEVSTQQALQAGQRIDSVSLYRSGHEGPSCSADASSSYSPFRSQGGTASYFVDADGRLESLDAGSDNLAPASRPVTGALAPAGFGRIGGFAVAPDSAGDVAVLSSNQRDLYISTLTQKTAPAHPVVTSTTGDLSSPSWDGLGTLWVADSDPAAPVLWAVVGGKPMKVPVLGLQGVVTGVRAAADGARIALTVTRNGSSSVQIGRIEQTGTVDAPVLIIDGLQQVTPQPLNGVRSVSWYDGDSLIVLGQSAKTAPVLSTWEVDGSSALAAVEQLPSPAPGMTTVSALQQDSSLQQSIRAPLLGDSLGAADAKGTKSKGTIYRWVKNQWVAVGNGDPGDNGPMPSYPG